MRQSSTLSGHGTGSSARYAQLERVSDESSHLARHVDVAAARDDDLAETAGAADAHIMLPAPHDQRRAAAAGESAVDEDAMPSLGRGGENATGGRRGSDRGRGSGGSERGSGRGSGGGSGGGGARERGRESGCARGRWSGGDGRARRHRGRSGARLRVPCGRAHRSLAHADDAADQDARADGRRGEQRAATGSGSHDGAGRCARARDRAAPPSS